jgi:hypothetical protein
MSTSEGSLLGMVTLNARERLRLSATLATCWVLVVSNLD